MSNDGKTERKLPIIDVDADPRNADWIKFRWHLPRYKSQEFMKMLAIQYPHLPTDEERLAHFRTLPIYEFAVEQGKIVDDEWQDPLQRIARRSHE